MLFGRNRREICFRTLRHAHSKASKATNPASNAAFGLVATATPVKGAASAGVVASGAETEELGVEAGDSGWPSGASLTAGAGVAAGASG